MINNRIPVENNMWIEKNNEIVLIGSKCSECGELFFPIKEFHCCSNCQSDNLTKIELSKEGIVHSYTIIHQRPSGGYYFGEIPFAYGIIELEEGLHLQTHIKCDDFSKIKVGKKVKLILDLLHENNGEQIETYKFKLLNEE